MLAVAGFNVESLTSSTSHQDRTRIIEEFNTEGTNVQVLFVGLNLAPFGIDLQKQCHHGVFLNFHWNGGTVEQAIGRLFRNGQLEPVLWVILKVVDSFYDVVERSMAIKWAPTICAEADFKDRPFRNRLLLLCTFELMRVKVGAPWNRFP